MGRAFELLDKLTKLPEPERKAAVLGAGAALQLAGGLLGKVGALLARETPPRDTEAPASGRTPRSMKEHMDRERARSVTRARRRKPIPR